jgi:hypothetical protein
MKNYPLLGVRVSTPTLELRGATDELLDQLAEVVRAGKTHADPAPYDDPMSSYEPDPDLRVAKWLRAIWRRRGKVEPDAWRLYFVVMVAGRPVGEQTLTGANFSTLGTVTTFSSCSPRCRTASTRSPPYHGAGRPCRGRVHPKSRTYSASMRLNHCLRFAMTCRPTALSGATFSKP